MSREFCGMCYKEIKEDIKPDEGGEYLAFCDGLCVVKFLESGGNHYIGQGDKKEDVPTS